MVLETWLIKVKKTISHNFNSLHATPPPARKPAIKKSKVGVLAFEVAGIMPKLTHMWRFLSDENMARLRTESVCLEGVRKIVSDNDAFLLGLACAETVEGLRTLAKSVSGFSKNCEDPSLRCFEAAFDSFATTGCDPYGWVLSFKDMEAKNKKIERCVCATSALRREMDEVTHTENNLKKSLKCVDSSGTKQKKILDLQEKLIWQKQEVKYLKEKSLWNKSFDTITSLLATSIFTTLSRIKLVFGVTHDPPSLPRSLSASATVHPSDLQDSNSCNFVSGPLIKASKDQENHHNLSLGFLETSFKTSKDQENHHNLSLGFLETSSNMLKPAPNTLGDSALALHYANLIIVMEKMIRSPQLVGLDARDDLYSMLPSSVRSWLRRRLRGIGFTASDSSLAGEWKEALGKILGWLSPLAHNMIKWQSERSFEHQNSTPKTNVLLLQTLFYANRQRAEAAITELLVGLNYIWRFEREMNAKVLFNSTNFNSFMNMHQFS